SRTLRSTVLAVSFAALLSPVMAHARNYEVINADVPFKFNVGKRSFRPGHYQLILVGPGLATLRDSHSNVIASLITRSRETDSPAPATKLIFNKDKKHSQLAEIRMADRSQVIDILGEELAIAQTSLPHPAPPRWEIESVLDQLSAPRSDPRPRR